MNILIPAKIRDSSLQARLHWQKALTRVFGVILMFLLLGACATSTTETRRLPTDAEVEQYNASVTPDERIVCRLETPIGSNIPRRVCRLAKDIDETSEFHREQLRRSLF